MQSHGSPISYPPGQAMQFQPMNVTLTANYQSGQGGRATFNQPPSYQSNVYNPPRPPEVYTLSESVNEALEPSVRTQFQHDNFGRVLFFTAPPLDRACHRVSSGRAALAHSLRYRAGMEEWRRQRERKRRQRKGLENRRDTKDTTATQSLVSARVNELVVGATEAMKEWFRRFDGDTSIWMHNYSLADDKVDE